MSFWSTLGSIGGGLASAAGNAFGTLIGGKYGNSISSAVSGLLGVGGNAASQAQGNKAALQMQQLGFQHQEDMLDKQYNQQIQLIDKANKYNSPVNQANLYREAGINPFFALGNGASGVGQSVTPSSPSAPSAGGSFAGFTPDYSSNLRESAIHEIVGKSEANLNDTSASNNTALTAADIALKSSEAGLIDKKSAGQEIINNLESLNLRIGERTEDAKVRSAYSSADEQDLKVELVALDLLASEFNVKAMPVRFKNELALNLATIKNLAASSENFRSAAYAAREAGLLSKSLRSSESAKRLLYISQARLNKHELAVIDATADNIRHLARQNNWNDDQIMRYTEAIVSGAESSSSLGGKQSDWYELNTILGHIEDFTKDLIFIKAVTKTPGPMPKLKGKSTTRYEDGSYTRYEYE